MSINSKMTALADEIRELSGTTDSLSIDTMTSTLNTENTNFNTNLATQDDLIAQIQTALQGKASGGEPEPVVLQDKTITPTTSTQTITADPGYEGLGSVTVNAIPTAVQATPSISVNSSGLITASVSQTAGYVEAGTKSATKQLTTQAAKSITPSTSAQTAVASGVYTTGAVTVNAIPSSYVQPTATKAATTYTPSTSNQTIAAGTYCSGTQTIKGDANLVADNIKSGVSIFGVTGNYEGSGGGGSGGGNIETVTFSVVEDGPTEIWKRVLYYVDANGNASMKSRPRVGESILVAKNSLCATHSQDLLGGVEVLSANETATTIYKVIGDFYVKANF